MAWLATFWAFLVGASVCPGLVWLLFVYPYSGPGSGRPLVALVAGLVFGFVAVLVVLTLFYRGWR